MAHNNDNYAKRVHQRLARAGTLQIIADKPTRTTQKEITDKQHEQPRKISPNKCWSNNVDGSPKTMKTKTVR
jgi:hypothetical protein